MKKLASLLCLLIAASAPSFAAEPPTKVTRTIPTVTLLVKTFSELEGDWIDAVQAKDRTAIDNLLAPNFEVRTAAAPGQPTPREESIKHALQQAPFASQLGQMAAHEFGDVVIVSFLWKLEVTKSNSLAQQIFVVDTWKKIDGKWQVMVRYASPSAAPAKAVPGAETGEPVIKKKI